MKHPSRFKMTKLKKKDMVEKTQSVFETQASSSTLLLLYLRML